MDQSEVPKARLEDLLHALTEERPPQAFRGLTTTGGQGTRQELKR